MLYYVTMAFLAIAFFINIFSGGGSARVLREIFYGFYFAEDAVTDDEDVPNSPEAVAKCVEAGIGIKTELYTAKDGRPFVSAFNDLSKQYGMDRKISESSSDELEGTLLSITRFIELVDGKVPVIFEIKSGENNELACRLTADAINASGHKNIAVVSFHAGIIAWFKKKEKKIFRGLISAPAKDFTSLSKWDRFLTGNLGNNSVARPQFVLYRNKKQSVFVKLAFATGTVKGIWLITDKETGKQMEETQDMIICRGFMPENGQFKELGEREKSQLELDIEAKDAKKAARRQAKLDYEAKLRQENAITTRERAIAAGYIDEDTDLTITEYVDEDEAVSAEENTEN